MSSLEQKLQFFIQQAGLQQDETMLEPLLIHFFEENKSAVKHVIYKNAILYLFNGHTIVETKTTVNMIKQDSVYKFDGERTTRITTSFYTGSDNNITNDQSNSGTNNNNNNNNNNNGNNG
jgi:hypothetical protein